MRKDKNRIFVDIFRQNDFLRENICRMNLKKMIFVFDPELLGCRREKTEFFIGIVGLKIRQATTVDATAWQYCV